MGLRGLRYYLVAAEEMNFRRAAEKLYITQQTLSVHIQKLEKQYGVQLFERKPKLMLTPAGAALVDYARKTLRLESLFQAQLADLSDTSMGHLDVGITGIRGTIFMPRIWERFHKEFPNITLSLTEASTARLDDLLEKGRLDLYIGVDAPVRSDTEVWTLTQEKVCCVASQSFINEHFSDGGRGLFEKARNGGLELNDVISLPLVAFSRGNSLRDTLEEFCEKVGKRPNVMLETSRHDLVLRFCQQGGGIGLIYQMILYDMMNTMREDPSLRVFPMKNLSSPKYTNLVYRRESYKPRYMSGFIQTAQTVFREYAENADAVIRRAIAER